MNRIGAAVRAAAVVIVLVAAALALGPPVRPTLPVGAVDAPAVTGFVVDGLRLLITVAVWYLLVATVVTGAAALPGIGAMLRPLAHRLTSAGLGVVVRRVLATSAVVGVSLPGAAAAGSGNGADQPPVMVPVDPAAFDQPADHDPGFTTMREAEGQNEEAAAAEAEPDLRSDPGGQPAPPTEPSGGTPPPRQEDNRPRVDSEPRQQDPVDAPRGQPSSTARPSAPHVDAPTMQHRGGSTDVAVHADEEHEIAAPVMTHLDAEPSSRPSAAAGPSSPSTPQAPTTRTPTTRTPNTRSSRHVVAAGESFWTIAEDRLRADLDIGSADTDLDAVATVWQRLIDDNADILVDPGNPDLLHRGQVIDLSGLE